MRRLLALGFLVGACSGGAAQSGGVPAGGGENSTGGKLASMAGKSSASAGVTSAGGLGSSAGEASAGSISSQAGTNASGTGGQAADGGEDPGGTGGQTQVAGSGGTSGGSGGAAQAGAAGVAGGGGSSNGGGAGGAPTDPCEGVAHWSPTDKITDYTPRPPDADGSWRGDLRVFGGILWAAQANTGCQTYPGKGAPEGWIKIATCAGGPIDETAPCQCAAGACCDGCYLRGQSYFCGETVHTSQCTGPALNQCGGALKSIDKDYWNLFCDGISAGDCTRWGPHTKYTIEYCPPSTGCVESGDQASCVACTN